MNEMAKIRITVNGEVRVTEACTLSELCRELGFTDMKIATARNGEFVPEKSRGQVNLAGGESIEIVSPRQGG